jgi:lipoyl-dependent peroxiredoxin
MPTRKAGAEWNGTLKAGNGTFKGESGLGGPYSFSSRFESGTGSNPEELIAAAHAACYSMALSGGLEKAGATPERVRTDAACTVEHVGGGFKITSMVLTCRVKAGGITPDKFREVAEATKHGCPVSGALANNVQIDLDAALE